MARISSQQVKHIAALARLRLGKKEIKEYQKDLTEILSYVAQLRKVKKPASKTEFELKERAKGFSNRLRDDKSQVLLEFDKKELRDAAPDKEDRFFKIPPLFK